MIHSEEDDYKTHTWVWQVPNQVAGKRGLLRTAERAIDRKALYETRRNRKARMIAEHRDRKRRAGRAGAWDGGWVVPFVCVCVACVVILKSV